MLSVVDEYTRECRAIEFARHLRSDDVLYRLSKFFARRGRRSTSAQPTGQNLRRKLFEIGSSVSR